MINVEQASREILIDALIAAGAVVNGNAIICPFHDDHAPSGGVYQKEDGVYRFKCQACGWCGDIYDVRAAASGKNVNDVLKEQNSRPKGARRLDPVPQQQKKPARVYPDMNALQRAIPGQFEQAYTFTNLNGGVDLITIRYNENGKKGFRQVSLVDGGYIMRSPEKPWPIYNRKRISNADTVVVVEGEKCVHVLASIGIVATTNPCGAGKADHCSWEPLAGKKVILWPDNDQGGRDHMDQVATILEALQPKVQIAVIEPHDLDLHEKEDVADFIDQCNTLSRITQEEVREMVLEALKGAASKGASSEVEQLLKDTISGKRAVIGFPWPQLTKATRALLPGTITLLCGDPGATKSFILLQALAHWDAQDIPCACFEMEEDRQYHLGRALAQFKADSNILDPDWIKENPEETMKAFEEYREELDSLGTCIWEAPDTQQTLDDVADWILQRAKEGCRVICVDPITAAEAGDKPWIADANFMLKAKVAVRKYGASLVLVTHPKKGSGGVVDMDSLAGGAAYQRFSQAVLWVRRHDKCEQKTCKSMMGRGNADVNRTIHCVKTRNGIGAGLDIGYWLDGGTLLMDECGIIIDEE